MRTGKGDGESHSSDKGKLRMPGELIIQGEVNKMMAALSAFNHNTSQKRSTGMADEEQKQVKEQVQMLHNLLKSAQATLIQKDEELKQLTAPPLLQGVVLEEYIIDRDDIQYKVGDRVQLLVGAYKHQVGKITAGPDQDKKFGVELPLGEFVTVESHTSKNREIEATARELGGNFDSFKLKELVVVIKRGDKRWGEIGTITLIDNNKREVYVWFNDGEMGWYFVGGGVDKQMRLVDEPLDTVLVATADRQLVVERPPTMDIYPGSRVLVNQQTLAIVDVDRYVSLTFGEMAIISEAFAGDMVCKIDFGGVSRRLPVGYDCDPFPKEGDKVLLDPSSSIIMVNYGSSDAGYQFQGTTGITWDDVGGLTEAKRQMIEAIELPYKNKELYAAYNKKPIKGILLYGPPGCGKTMLAKAAASSMQQLHRGEGAETGFIYIKGPEILERFVGVAEATIRSIFAQARDHKQKHGYPATVFIDEADAILGKRGTGISSDMEKTIVPMFLAEMDGLDDSAALFILATNRADILDPAILRDGRIDRKIKITRPDMTGAYSILSLNLGKVPIHPSSDFETLSGTVAKHMFEKVLYNVKRDDGVASPFTLGHICNGGMIAGIVDQATSIAMNRDIAFGNVSGVCLADMYDAVDAIYDQNYELDHRDDLNEFVAPFYGALIEVTKVTRGV
jgi:proteasome-associated ATPase